MRASAPAAACEQHSYFDVLDIRDPVALPSRKARLCPFAIEVRRCTAKERLIHIFERVDADHRVKITTSRAPRGLEVHTPPCLMQNEQLQARAGISAGSGSQVRENEMFPQWHLPWTTITRACAERRGSRARPRRTSRIHSASHAYRCRSGDAPRNRARQAGWRDAARRSGRRADTAGKWIRRRP